MTTPVLIPMTIVVLLGEPVSLPCERELPTYRVTPAEAAVGAPVQDQGMIEEQSNVELPLDAVRLSYDVDARVLVAHPVLEGRVYCDGFEVRQP